MQTAYSDPATYPLAFLSKGKENATPDVVNSQGNPQLLKHRLHLTQNFTAVHIHSHHENTTSTLNSVHRCPLQYYT